VKKYEGLFILNTAGKEDSVKDIIDRVTNEITNLGGKVETVQKMDKRNFTRIADKKFTSGYFVNVIFEAKPDVISQLNTRFNINDDIFRVIFTHASAAKPEAAAPVAA
jgi:small subunit ribosomal protein S6